jgi:hypothetical protein
MGRKLGIYRRGGERERESIIGQGLGDGNMSEPMPMAVQLRKMRPT